MRGWRDTNEAGHMNLKIISDGTSFGTRIIDADTGVMVDGVQSLKWEIKVGGFAEVEMILCKVPVELTGEVERKTYAKPKRIRKGKR
jgi:hypothetical protein